MKKLDFLIIAGVLIVALAVWLLLPHGTGSSVRVTVNGQVCTELPLDKDTEYLIESDGNGENLLVISGGEASVVTSNCPNGVCVDTGAISEEGEIIVCLPHKVVIEIVG